MSSKKHFLVKSFLFCFVLLLYSWYLERSEQVKRKENTKREVSKKIEEYATSFTIHGLSKVYTGNKLEKCIWLTFVLVAVVVSGFIIKIFVTKYQRRDVYQSHSSTFTARLYYPQVTFCLLNLSPRNRPPKYFTICDTGIRKHQSCNKYKGPFAW